MVTIYGRDSTGVSRDVAGVLGSTANRWKGKFFFDNSAANNGSLTVDVTFSFTDYPTGSTFPGGYAAYRIISRTHGATSGPWTNAYTASGANTSQVFFAGVVVPAGTSLDWTLATTDSTGSPLPVTLDKFTGKKDGQNVFLNWTTASEINNSHFDVERSTNGMSWSTIASIQGHGTSMTENQYSYSDNLSDMSATQAIYYRLKQVDFNGAYQYSWIVAINNSGSIAGLPVIFPTLAIGLNQINLNLSPGTTAVLETNGGTILERLDPSSRSLNISGLRSGMYYVVWYSVDGASGSTAFVR